MNLNLHLHCRASAVLQTGKDLKGVENVIPTCTSDKGWMVRKIKAKNADLLSQVRLWEGSYWIKNAADMRQVA